jgi:two-component system NtrC family sensor kinase
MRRLGARLPSGSLQAILVISFVLVAAIALSLGLLAATLVSGPLRLVLALAAILIAALLAILVSRYLTGPIQALLQASRQAAHGDLTGRLPKRGPRELATLSQAFNATLQTLEANQLAQAERLASLEQLTAGVAHEINNPLGTILLYADILRAECGQQEQNLAALELISSEARRCQRIADALLDFSRRQPIVPQLTDLNALLQNVIEVEQRHEKYTGVPIVTEFDPALSLIQADAALLRQVIINLLNNAVEAMPKGGRLTLRTRQQPAGMVTVEVADTGVGIPPENLHRLFQPFFTTKPPGQGTGLGLTIVASIVRQHHGQISVQSQVGHGTTFTFHLPMQVPMSGTLIG